MHNDDTQMQNPAVNEPEGAMAKADLYRAAKSAIKLFELFYDDQQLEGWVQAKISKAADYLDSIYHYMEFQMKFGPQGAPQGHDSVETLTGDAPKPEIDLSGVEESIKYEERLEALLESALLLEKKAKKDYDKDGKIESEKDEVWGSRLKAAKEKKKSNVEEDIEDDVSESKPSAGMTAKEKSTVVKKAKKGKDIGKPGKGFEKVASKAAKQYGSKEKGQKVAAAAMWKQAAKK